MNKKAGKGKFLPLVLAVATAALVLHADPTSGQQLSPDQSRAIDKEAYIYGFPLVDSYRIQYSYFVDHGSPEFKVPWDTLSNTLRVYTPNDKAIQTPNSDTIDVPPGWSKLQSYFDPTGVNNFSSAGSIASGRCGRSDSNE